MEYLIEKLKALRLYFVRKRPNMVCGMKWS